MFALAPSLADHDLRLKAKYTTCGAILVVMTEAIQLNAKCSLAFPKGHTMFEKKKKLILSPCSKMV